MTTLLLLLLAPDAQAAELYAVRAGESLARIAAATGVSEDDLRAANGIAAGAEPLVGDILTVPGSGAVDGGSVVLSLSGVARVRAQDGSVRAAAVAQTLSLGDTLCTERESYATVRLAARDDNFQHDEITLLAGTCVTIDASAVRAGRRSSVVSVQAGSIAVREAPAGSGTVSVRGGSGVISGDGGGFRVTVEPLGSARTEALYRGVAVIGAGAQLDLQAGYGSRVEVGKPPSAPVKLPPFGEPLTPVDGAMLRRPDFAWTPAPEALSYRVEISATEDFTDLVLVDEVPGRQWLPERLFLPYQVEGWWWRVSGIDRSGYVGIPSPASTLGIPPPMR